MQTLAEPTATTNMLVKKPVRIDYTLAALYRAGGMSYKEIAEKMHCSPGSIRVGLSAKKMTQAANTFTEHAKLKLDPTHYLKAASDALRNTLSGELARTASALTKIPTRGGLGGLERRTRVLEPIARTARIVHDWGNTTVIGLIDSTVLKSADVIDVSNEPLGEAKDVTPTLPESCDSEKT